MSMSNDTEAGLIYVLTNEAMPGLVKIGITGSDPSSRADQLYTTGVPVPFTVEFAGEVPNPRPVEQALHNAFRDHRINPKREFFEIEPDQPIEMLRAFGVVDVTSTVSQEIDSSASESERNSRDRLSKRRPVFNFFDMGIPVGSELTFDGDGETIVSPDERQVTLNDTPTRSRAPPEQSRASTTHPADTSLAIRGRLVQDIYNETYPAAAQL